MPHEHSCVEFKIIFGLLFMIFAVFLLSVLINSAYLTLDYLLFVISHRVFLFHFLLLLFFFFYFKRGEFILTAGVSGEIRLVFLVQTTHISLDFARKVSNALFKSISVFKSIHTPPSGLL